MRELDVADPSITEIAELIYRRDGERMWRALLLFSGNREVASDAVAEAFAQALRRGRALHSPERWLWRAAFRIAAGEMQEMRRKMPAPVADSVGSYELSVDNMELVGALSQLSSHQRKAVLLHHVGGYSLEETARIIGSTRSAVSVHLVRGRRSS